MRGHPAGGDTDGPRGAVKKPRSGPTARGTPLGVPVSSRGTAPGTPRGRRGAPFPRRARLRPGRAAPPWLPLPAFRRPPPGSASASAPPPPSPSPPPPPFSSSSSSRPSPAASTEVTEAGTKRGTRQRRPGACFPSPGAARSLSVAPRSPASERPLPAELGAGAGGSSFPAPGQREACAAGLRRGGGGRPGRALGGRRCSLRGRRGSTGRHRGGSASLPGLKERHGRAPRKEAAALMALL